MSIQQNLQRIRTNIQKHSTSPEEVNLVAVTKNRSIQEIEEAIKAGAKIIGENRVQEAEEKFPILQKRLGKKLWNNLEKHLIGHLQGNKVGRAVRLFNMIQSVDSERLAVKINDEARKIGKIMPILLQINISNDPDKYGFEPFDTEKILQKATEWPNLHIQGLMTVGKLTPDMNERREYFKKFRELFSSIKPEMRYLSMGMSQDYLIALEEGANIIRIGSEIFEKICKTDPK